MTKKLLIVLLLGHGSILTNGQGFKKLSTLIQTADSIVFISHEVTAEYRKSMPDWDIRDTSMNLQKWLAKNPPLLKFLDSGKINEKIIIEKGYLSKNDRVKLDNILTQKVTSESSNQIKCDEPRHTIIFYKENKQSYLDICFACNKMHASTDIIFSSEEMTISKWKKLKLFFQEKGLTKMFRRDNE